MDVLLQRQHAGKQQIGLPPARFEIPDAALHDGRTQVLPPVLDVRTAHPALRDNAVVEGVRLVFAEKCRNVDDPEKLLARLRVDPEVHPDQFPAGDVAAGLLEHFADHRLFR